MTDEAIDIRKIKADMMPLAELIPYENNAKVHPDSQVEQIARSISEFGWTYPILADEHFVIIAGHGRYLAAEKLGMEKVPVAVLDGLSDSQVKQLRIADNRIAENATWDYRNLELDLTYLRDAGLDITLTGFDPGEVDSIIERFAGADQGLNDALNDMAGDGAPGAGEDDLHTGGDGPTAAPRKLAKKMKICPKCGHQFEA